MTPGLILDADNSSDVYDAPLYKSVVASLIYLATSTRPDIAFTVSALSRYFDAPSHSQWSAITRILEYLFATKTVGITLGNSFKFQLTAFSDSDWAGDLQQRKSTTGFLIYCGDSLVSWASKRQQIVALSTTEAEFVAATEAVKDMIWCKLLLDDAFNVPSQMKIFVDNQPAINLAKKQKTTRGRTKHIDVRMKFIQQMYTDKLLAVEKVLGTANPADLLTKPVQVQTFKALVDQLVL
jgi:hypothetical protein